MKPVVSVVISDYASGERKAWADLRVTLAALGHQDIAEPAEVLLVENTGFAPRIPADLMSILPNLKLINTPSELSYDLKNEGARAASADLVILLDGDCAPPPNWVRHRVGAIRARPLESTLYR